MYASGYANADISVFILMMSYRQMFPVDLHIMEQVSAFEMG